jgi:hypothetical protein
VKISSTLRALAAACAFAVASQAGAAVLQVNTSGILTGATGVDVGGKLYDVTFADGSCNSVFNGCVRSAFAFTTEATATLAARSLLEQVFLDGPKGQFDSNPGLTFGCIGASFCATFLPYSSSAASYINVMTARNGAFINSDVISIGLPNKFIDSSSDNNLNFAVFKVAAPTAVPEPTSIALFGLALAGLAFTRRRKA